MSDIISKANNILNELHLIEMLLNSIKMPKKYHQFFLFTIQDCSNYFEVARKYSYGNTESLEATFDSLETMLDNIGSKLCHCLMCDFNKHKSNLREFNLLDEESLDESENDSLVQDFVRKQQLYYPQLINDSENLEIAEFKIIDMDKFNDLLK